MELKWFGTLEEFKQIKEAAVLTLNFTLGDSHGGETP